LYQRSYPLGIVHTNLNWESNGLPATDCKRYVESTFGASYAVLKSINVVYYTNGRHDSYDKLLAFAACHNIKLVCEKFPLTGEGIVEALENLEKGTMRYRGVPVAEA
jgi:D-arabinose 1-dehydrogenase-like Zn-dependent alcohol dehydrogenase